MKLYIVQGCNADYSAPVVWLVAAYTDKEAANQHCKLLNEYINTKRFNSVEELKRWFNENPYDKIATDEYPPTEDYEVLEVNLFRHVDEYQDSA